MPGCATRRLASTSNPMKQRLTLLLAAAVTVATVAALTVVAWNTYRVHTCQSQPVKGFRSNFTEYGADQYTSFHHRSQMRLVENPTGSNKRVLSMTARSSDVGVTSNPRVQMAVPGYPLNDCTEFWASVSVYIPTMSEQSTQAMSAAAGHVIIAQIYGPPFAGPAPLRIGWNHDPQTGQPAFGVGAVAIEGDRSQTIDIWREPLRTDRWITVAIHMLMSTNPNEGYVQVWADMGNRQGLTPRILNNGEQTYNYPTLNSANFDAGDPRGNTMYLDSYWPARANIEEITVLFRDNAIGNSLSEVTPEEMD